jgi:hypothetical protein
MTSSFLLRMGCFYFLLVPKKIEIHPLFFAFTQNSLDHPIFVAKAKSLTPPEKAAKSNANNNRLYSLASNAKPRSFTCQSLWSLWKKLFESLSF